MSERATITLITYRGSSTRWWDIDSSKPIVSKNELALSFTDSKGGEVSIYEVGKRGSVLIVEKPKEAMK